MIDEHTKKKLEERYYPDLEQAIFGPLHGALSQKELIGARVLDAGCGKGTWILQPYKPRFRLLAGVDIYLPEKPTMGNFSLANLENLPFQDASFDLVMCYLVLEHIRRPEIALAEFSRVLRPGGKFLFKTPCAYAPSTLVSRFLPFAAHRFLKSLIGTDQKDVFPTYYRCNTVSKLRQVLEGVGFSCELIQVDQTYAYLSFSELTYTLGLMYSRAIGHPWLHWLRNGILGICRKEGG